MRLLLVTAEPGWGETLRSLFPSDDIIGATVAMLLQNPPLAAAVDACLVAEAQTTPWTLETLKQLSAATTVPLFVLTDSNRSQWEETALFAGAEQIFRRPLKGAVLQLAITRAQRRNGTPAAMNELPVGGAEMPDGRTSEALALWRDFSRLLRHARDHMQLLNAYVEALRDVLRCTRALIYLPDSAAPGAYRCAVASGVDRSALDSFRLHVRSGLGHVLAERGTAVWLRRLRATDPRDTAANRELAVFGGELAVPIAGPGGMAAIVILGPRICGSAYSEHEVALVHQSVEPISSGFLQPATSDREPEWSRDDLLEAMPLPAAVVTVARSFTATNTAFRALLGHTSMGAISLEDLPPAWASAISAVLQNGAGSARVELEHRSIGTPRKVRLTVRRLDGVAAVTPFLVTVEDIVPSNGGLDTDPHSIANLLQRAGEQLSNEFRNALTPVDIMVQLSHEPSTTRGELEQLSTQVSTAIHRLRRRIDDLAYLTKSAIIPEPTVVSAVLRLTRERLDEWIGHKQLKRVVWLNEFSTTELTADCRALAVALAELVMNALEACEGKQVTVTAENTGDLVSFRLRNSGVWAPPAESSGFRHRPFVSSKSTGVGLGIEVATRVAEHHGGKLVVGPIGPDAVEAILRVPRTVRPHATPRIEPGAVRVN